jgi:transglutaminase-like putative cysteine protease
LFSAAIRLQTTNWTEHLGLVEVIVALAAVFGLALGKSRFPGHITFGMGLVYSLFVIPWQLGLLIPYDMDWPSRLEIIYARLWYSTADFLSNKPVRDPILFLTTMMVLYWFASIFASYRLVRHASPWVPLLSLGGMILVIEYTVEMYPYARATGGIFSFAFLIFCLLLMGRIYFLQSRKEWEQRGGMVEMEVGYDLGRGVIIAAVAVALVAWNTPQIINFFEFNSPARERVSEGWRVFRDRISKAANTLRSPNPAVIEGYSSDLSLGRGGNQSQELVFTVKPDNGKQDRRMYWSARTYDAYDDGQWASSQKQTVSLGPQYVPLIYPSWAYRQSIQFTFDTRIPLLKNLFYVNEPYNLDRSAQAIVTQTAEGGIDFNTLVMDPPLKARDSYTVRSTIAVPTVLSLRQATNEYPDWVKGRYLQVPKGFSPRVKALAHQIADEQPTTYDKVQAITQYLRRTITYTETVPQPPADRDPLEWFLFDQRAGFCNYYASSEVMMLRALGIPARLVIGYAEGEWNASQGVYEVHGRDSHAWPEVYFPELGWIQFEPTVSQPTYEFPQGESLDQESAAVDAANAPQPTLDPRSLAIQEERANRLLEEENQRSVIQNQRSYITIALAVVALALLALGFWGWRRWKAMGIPLPSWIEKILDGHGFRTPRWLHRWSQNALRTPIESLFANVAFVLRIWGQKVNPAQTPAEQIHMLIQVVPGVEPQAKTLLQEYQRAMYSPYPADIGRARQAVNELRVIGLRNWFRRMIGLEAA